MVSAVVGSIDAPGSTLESPASQAILDQMAHMKMDMEQKIAAANEVAKQVTTQIEALVENHIRKFINPLTGQSSDGLG